LFLRRCFVRSPKTRRFVQHIILCSIIYCVRMCVQYAYRTGGNPLQLRYYRDSERCLLVQSVECDNKNRELASHIAYNLYYVILCAQSDTENVRGKAFRFSISGLLPSVCLRGATANPNCIAWLVNPPRRVPFILYARAYVIYLRLLFIVLTLKYKKLVWEMIMRTSRVRYNHR